MPNVLPPMGEPTTGVRQRGVNMGMGGGGGGRRGLLDHDDDEGDEELGDRGRSTATRKRGKMN